MGSHWPRCHAKEFPRDGMPWTLQGSEEQLLHIPGEAVSCLTSRDSDLCLHSCKALLRYSKRLPQNPKPRQDASHPCPGCQTHCTITFCANEIQNLLSCSHAELTGKKINGSYQRASSVLVQESEIPIEASVTHGCGLAQIRPRLDNKGHVLFRAISENFCDPVFITPG